MVALSEQRKGEVYELFGMLLWSLFPVVTILTISKVPALAVFAWGTLFSACFFACVMLYRGTWREMRNPMLWRHLVYVALLIGVCYYGLYFVGLGLTSAGNASLIAKLEILTSFAFFHVIRREAISQEHIVGLVCMLLGAMIVLAPNVSDINYGDILIVTAIFFPPIGNLFQQRARQMASSETIMFMRTIIATPFIFLLAFVLGQLGSLQSLYAALPLLLINGLLLLGFSKILWIEAIHRISVAKANALGSAGPALTLIFAWAFLGQLPSFWQLSALVPMIIGVLLLTDFIKISNRLQSLHT